MGKTSVSLPPIKARFLPTSENLVWVPCIAATSESANLLLEISFSLLEILDIFYIQQVRYDFSTKYFDTHTPSDHYESYL